MKRSNTTFDLEDKILVRKINAGDETAFEKIVEKYQSKVRGFIKSKGVKSFVDIEDLTQETFLQMHRSIDKFEGRSNFSTWLIGISWNLICNHVNRSYQYQYEMLDIAEINLSANPQCDPCYALESEQTMAQLERSIAQIPDNLQLCLHLTAYKGYSYEEAATAIGVSVGSLKSRIFRARQRLKVNYKAYGT